jgi:hypothetical protein
MTGTAAVRVATSEGYSALIQPGGARPLWASAGAATQKSAPLQVDRLTGAEQARAAALMTTLNMRFTL